MTQLQSEPPQATPPDDISRAVARVYSIELTGLPRALVLDAAAIWGADRHDDLAEAILSKLHVLAEQNAMHVLVRSATPWQMESIERALPLAQLALESRTEDASASSQLSQLTASSGGAVAVLAAANAVVPMGCTAFLVGDGPVPERAHPTSLKGPIATDFILDLWGTALVQERAGIAFRDISEGKSVPSEAPAARESLNGVVRSVGVPPAPKPTARTSLPDAPALAALAERTYSRLMRNVLPNGAVVGSPAQGKEPGQPNYWFYWQRDGSVTMGHLIDWHRQPPLGLPTRSLAETIGRYLNFVVGTQRAGQLGASRYTTDGQPITGFGNPQLDGPPLSALTLARMEPSADVWESLRTFLEFLLTPEGSGPCMDPWEFIYGWHFNAAFLKRRALLVGAARAAQLGYASDAQRYRDEAQRVAASLDDFVDRKLGRLRAFGQTYNPWFAHMSGLDMSVICALLSGRDLHAQIAAPAPRTGHLRHDLDSLTHPAVLATMTALEGAYATFFNTNRDWTAAGNAGFGLGRFPEDANDGVGTNGGNPWPLASLWGAQFYYQLAHELAQVLAGGEGHAIVLDDERQVAFFQRTASVSVKLNTPIELAAWKEMVLPALLARGDGFLNFVVQHILADGGVTEQIDRDTGAPSGARDLSWALSELIATIAMREQVTQAT